MVIKHEPAATLVGDKDNGDGMSESSYGSVHDGTMTHPLSEERDEVREVEKTTLKDTRRLRFWRVVVTLSILLTALAVTLTTYRLLQDEQKENFETGYKRFSRTVVDAAVVQRQSVLDAIRAYADSLTIAAQTSNQTWPMVKIPFYEDYGGNFRKLSQSEISSFIIVVEEENKEAYPEFMTKHYEKMFDDAHIFRYGNTERLNRTKYFPYITRHSPDGLLPDINRTTYFPIQMQSPPAMHYGNVNWNLGSVPSFLALMESAKKLKNETLTSVVGTYIKAVGALFTLEEHNAMHDPLPPGEKEHPHNFYFHPVRERIDDPDSPVVGMVTGVVALDASSRNLLPDGVEGLQIVVRNTCGQNFTYELRGREAKYLGASDLHEMEYNDYEVSVPLTTHINPEAYTAPGHCLFTLSVYPSKKFEESYDSVTPEIFAAIIAFTFVLVTIAFLIYDVMVSRRNMKLVETAAKSSAIVTQLFPGKIRDQMIAQKEEEMKQKKEGGNKKTRLQSFVDGSSDGLTTKQPLAELFLEASILFADIVGFTAWSSTREPSQVFTLLETVFEQFDTIAKRRRIFKVETVGDCYVAASGIPDARRDHAIAMVQFANAIVHSMRKIVRKLETTLGPDTGDLGIRVGVHSGPVTAGVLRGERARFQLFGDTMNTAARLESTSHVGRVQLSKETAELLQNAGKDHWVEPRESQVEAKGKGVLNTFWLKENLRRYATSSVHSGSSEQDENVIVGLRLTKQVNGSVSDERTMRLVQWTVETLSKLLKQVVARRQALIACGRFSTKVSSKASVQPQSPDGMSRPLDEVKEIITLPMFDNTVAQAQEELSDVALSPEVLKELTLYVSSIAEMYRPNKFHNFEHASHVTMSVVKLLSRIVAPSELDADVSADKLHDHTYGITSDPLTQFACAFSAMIHDADHTGVPNQTLIQENATIAAVYNNRSVAEQNSLDLAWSLLEDEQFDNLRGCIAQTPADLAHFRQLVVNVVMATDIVDKELKQLRNARWEKAFSEEVHEKSNGLDAINRKATIVIEHLIQASDVSHTMQHWHVYRRWNENFFRECYAAYQAGRAASDPSVNWYKGEIGFFDFYVIPLAKKLKDCGVFGVSSGEFLDYALKNRQEWEAKGQSIVAEMLQTIHREAQA